MNLIVNGKDSEIAEGLTISRLLIAQDVKMQDMVSVELNGQILKRSAFETTTLKEGDKIEVKITGVDRKKRIISLSIKARESDDEQTTVKEYAPETGENSKLGDILKDELEK